MGLFDRFKKDAPAAGQAVSVVENPYVLGRREWNERYGSYIFQRNIGFAFGFAGLIVAGGAVGGLVHIGSQSKFVPYVIEVDNYGRPTAVSRADSAETPMPRVMAAQISEWVHNMRSVTSDAILQRSNVFKAYALLPDNTSARLKADEWFNGKGESGANPFERAAKGTVETVIQKPLPISPDTWSVDWEEIERDRDGKINKSSRYRVMVTVSITPPETEDQILANPTGLGITEFSWSKQF